MLLLHAEALLLEGRLLFLVEALVAEHALDVVLLPHMPRLVLEDLEVGGHKGEATPWSAGEETKN
jgi:hypothetical protein